MSEPQYGAGPEQPGQPSLNKPQQGTGGPGQPPPAYGAPQQPQQPQYGAGPQQPVGPPQGYGQPGPPQGYAGPAAELNPAEQRQWAMLGHLGALLIGWLSGLIVYLMYKDRGAFVRDQATEALNFQLTVLIGFIASWVLSSILSFFTFGLSFFLPFIVYIGAAIFAIIAGIAANKGEQYRYPFNIRMIK